MPHIHGGVAHLVNVFLGVAVIGIVWRIVAIWLTRMSGLLGSIGQAMSFAY